MPDTIAGMAASPPMMGSHAASESALHSLTGIGSDGFVRLLVAQLQYQSPLEPSDPGDLMLQTAQLAQLDATMQMASLQQRDLGLQQAVLAASMVGAEVTAAGPDGAQVHGVVDAVRYTAMGPVLSVSGTEVVLAAVTEIRRNGAPLPPPPPLTTDVVSAVDGVPSNGGGSAAAGTDTGAGTADSVPAVPDAAPTAPDPGAAPGATSPDPTDDPTGNVLEGEDAVLAAPAPRDDDPAAANDTDVTADGSGDAADGVATNT